LSRHFCVKIPIVCQDRLGTHAAKVETAAVFALQTLELPFKDNAEFPIAETAWSGPRSVAFGKGVIEPMLRTLSHLR
jgi:hypothetical protein